MVKAPEGFKITCGTCKLETMPNRVCRCSPQVAGKFRNSGEMDVKCVQWVNVTWLEVTKKAG